MTLSRFLFAAGSILACSSAQALPVVPHPALDTPSITYVGYGCGPGFLPNKWGKCVPAAYERYNYARHAYDRRVEAYKWHHRYRGY